jgi:hypothetical protein
MSSAEGSYVALTRARERTHVYAAADRLGLAEDATPRAVAVALAGEMGRSEPQMPSISLLLAPEPSAVRSERREAEDDRLQLAQLRARRDELQAIVRTFPSQAAQRIDRLTEQAARSHSAADLAREQADAARLALDGLGRLARRGTAGQQLRAEIARAEAHEQREREARHDATAAIDAIQTGPDSPEHWNAEHPDARSQLQAANAAYAEAVEHQVDRVLEDQPARLQAVLGERPAEDRAADRDAWDGAARAIERYRIAHEIPESEASALGPEPQPGRESWAQHGDWRAAAEAAIDARERLGLTEREAGTLQERAAQLDGLLPEADRERERERDHGIEM